MCIKTVKQFWSYKFHIMCQNYRILLIFALFQKSRLISMIVMKFDFDNIFSLSYMQKLCHLQNCVLLLWYKDTFIDTYCLLQTHYASFHLSLLWVDSVLNITTYETMHNILFLWKFSQLKVIDSRKVLNWLLSNLQHLLG